ncbi:MAG: hypothetical protein ACE5H7_13890 [Acidiferrobacterales bacterium]
MRSSLINKHHDPMSGALCLILGLLLAMPGAAVAAAFDVSITPPRFEKRTKPGKIMRDRVRITNLDRDTGYYVFKTADWNLATDKGLTFNEGAPSEGSCRPWVRIERRKLTVPAGATKSYRFEVHVPPDTPVGECRFALLVSQDPSKVAPVIMGQLSLPVVGRIAVIVYLAIGNARPKLAFRGLQLQERDGKKIPVIILENLGNAHGRPFGGVTAIDVQKRKRELLVSEVPILVGQTRAIELYPVEWSAKGAAQTGFDLTPPLHIRGTIQWDGGSVKLDEVLR